MGREIVVVKLGGSIITDKSIPFSYRANVIAALGREIVSSGKHVVLVHGGGSFGHTVARNYGLSSSVSKSAPIGVAKTRDAMFKLNELVCNSLASAGVNPYTFSPFTLLRNERKKLASSWLKKLLDLGMTPITFGDVVPDARGFRIISGDTIAKELCDLLRAKRCIFVLGVDGVYDAGGKVLRVVRRADLGRMSPDKTTKDATGGIVFKVEEGFRMASRGVSVSFVSGLREKEFGKSLKGLSFYGSILKV